MSSFLTLLLLVTGMFISTFIFGTLPLLLPLSRRSLRYVELLGAGLLIGAALTVVIPEGVGTLMRASVELEESDRLASGRRWSKRDGLTSGDKIVEALQSGETILGFCLLGGFFLMFCLEQLSSQSGAQDIPSQSRSAGGRNSSSFRRAPQSSTRWQYEALSASGDADAPYADVDDESKAPKSKRASNDFVRLRRQKSVSIDGVGESDATPAGQLHRHRSHASRGSEAKGQGRDGSKRHSAGEESISSGECGSLLDESFDSSAVPGAPTLKTRPSYGGVGGGEEGEHGAGIGQPETFPADENGTHAPPNHSAARPQATALQQGPRIPGHASSATMLGHSRRLPSIFLRPSQDEERDDDTEGLLPAHRYSFHPQVSGFRTALASIFGLLIHAVADGIAMGASIASSNPGLRWIIFAAIMIHKAPASFGLCSVLLSRGLLKRDIAKALLIFSLCTPLGAVLTYLLLALFFHATNTFDAETLSSAAMHLASSSEDSTSRSQLYIGAALTFSGGTFLFVAMHALEDVTDSPGPDAGEGGHAAHRHDHEDHGDHPHAHPDESDWVRKPVRILLLLIGAIVPKSLQILTGGHQH